MPFDNGFELPPWHQENPDDLTKALRYAVKAAPHLDRLARFLLPRMPRHVLCSSSLKGAADCEPSARTKPLGLAIKHQWLSLNTRRRTNAVTVDCDTADWPGRRETLLSLGVPAPAMTVVSPWKGTAHLVWVLERPFDNASPAQGNLCEGIRTGLDLLMGGDRNFRNRLQKNPFHRGREMPAPGEGAPGMPGVWEAYVEAGRPLTYVTQLPPVLQAVSAQELYEPLLSYARDAGVRLLPPPGGRRSRLSVVRTPVSDKPAPGAKGTRLFEVARRRVYRARTADEGLLLDIVEQTARELGSPATARERRSIARSIARFMREKWTGSLSGAPPATRPIDAGAMAREAAGQKRLAAWEALPVRERRERAARRSAERYRARTDAALRNAWAALVVEGQRTTQSAVAARSGVSLSTVKRRWQELLQQGKVSTGPYPGVAARGAPGWGSFTSSNQAPAFPERKIAAAWPPSPDGHHEHGVPREGEGSTPPARAGPAR